MAKKGQGRNIGTHNDRNNNSGKPRWTPKRDRVRVQEQSRIKRNRLGGSARSQGKGRSERSVRGRPETTTGNIGDVGPVRDKGGESERG